MLGDTSNVDRRNSLDKLGHQAANTHRRTTRDNKENILDENNTLKENEQNAKIQGLFPVSKQEEDEPVKDETKSSGAWCVGHVLELCRLLGHKPVTALQTIAGLALDRGHLTVALAVVRYGQTVCHKSFVLTLTDEEYKQAVWARAGPLSRSDSLTTGSGINE